MQSYRNSADNPWNLFISDGVVNKIEAGGSKSTGYILENILSSSLPVSFTRSHNVVNCDICKVLVIKNRFKQHYEDRHATESSAGLMIPFEEYLTTDKNSGKIKKLKRSRKKRANYKEKIKYPLEYLEKKACNKTKVRTVTKRHHSKSFLDNGVYFGKTKKMKLVNREVLNEMKSYSVTDEGFMSSTSPKPLNYNFYQKSQSSSFDVYCMDNDRIYCSNDSVHRTSSDSSTPPSLSIGTLQTLSSSPSSLNIFNDPASVITEHYFLPSNDLTSQRSGVACKYQIDSLPWENFPSLSTKDEDFIVYSSKQLDSILDLGPGDEDGEVERAVQSITNLCDGFTNVDTKPDQNYLQKLDLLNADDASMIDCFLDEVLGGSSSSTKDHLSDSSFGACVPSQLPITSTQTSIMDDTVNHTMSDYQVDSNLLNSITSDYDEKFETLINNAMNEFIAQSPQNISLAQFTTDKKKSHEHFDPLKHCGVVASNGVFCHRSLLCKLHTMPQKRQVDRPESLTALIKGIRDYNKTKRLHKKESQSSNAFKSCNSSKTSSDSVTYNCSSTRSTEEASSFMENRLSTPDLDMSVLTCAMDTGATPLTIFDHQVVNPRPLVRSRISYETVVNGNRSLIAAKSMLWRHRPRSKYHSLGSQKCQPRMMQTLPGVDQDAGALTLPPAVAASSANLSSKHGNDLLLPQTYTSHYGLSCISNDGRWNQVKGGGEVTLGDIQGDRDKTVMCQNQLIYNPTTSNQHMSRLSAADLSSDCHQSSANMFVSLSDLNLSNNSLNIPTSNISAISNHNLSSGFFSGSCNNQIFNINPQFISSGDTANIVFSDQPNGHGYTLSNGNVLAQDTSSGSKFISLFDDGGVSNSGTGAGASILYPVMSGNQIMMMMGNKNGRIFNESQDTLYSDSNQLTSMPLNSFLALKQNNMQQDGMGGGGLGGANMSSSTQQLLSISPLELQRLTESLGHTVLDSANNDKPNNSIIYQLNQSQPCHGSFVAPSSITSKTDSNNIAKPVTVQSSTMNGVTQKFVILPDGTISAFTQQPTGVKTNYGQQGQMQHPIFGHLNNYGAQNQAYIINNDKILIAPGPGALTSGPTQQVLMPQIINHTDLNTHSSPALTFIHPHTSNLVKVPGRTVHNNSLTQIPVDSSQQKVSFQIQAPNHQYQNQISNAYFITAAPNTVTGNIPLKQQIYIQSNDSLASDISLMDSSGYFDGQCNSHTKSLSSMDSLSCNTDMGSSISSGSSQPDYQLVNHVLTGPQSLIIQQPHGNRYQTKTVLQSSGFPSSVDAAHSTPSNGQHQHILLNTNTTNHSSHHSTELFAQSQVKFSSQGQMPVSSQYFSCTPTSVGPHTASNYKSVPPPLVVSQQLLNQQSVTNQLRQKSFKDSSYQQQQPHHSQPQSIIKASQLPIDDSQFPNEYKIVQSMIA